MSDKYYLNEDKTYTKCDLETWANQFETMDRHVASDIINSKRISTVWLGLDHNHLGGEPLLFETMVFSQHNPGCEIFMNRYTTWDEALEGHQKAIDWVRNNYVNE